MQGSKLLQFRMLPVFQGYGRSCQDTTPKVHGALLARRDLDSHLDEIRAQNAKA